MTGDLWAKFHGASTHLPIAMVLGACVFDLAAVLAWARPFGRNAGLVGRYLIVLGAIGGIAAVFSGVELTRGQLWGSGALRWHHRFVWPAFALMMATAVWRAVRGDRLSRRGLAGYLVVELVLAALTAGAGYWGGELLLGGH